MPRQPRQNQRQEKSYYMNNHIVGISVDTMLSHRWGNFNINFTFNE